MERPVPLGGKVGCKEWRTEGTNTYAQRESSHVKLCLSGHAIEGLKKAHHFGRFHASNEAASLRILRSTGLR
jgi:hypothetical protein